MAGTQKRTIQPNDDDRRPRNYIANTSLMTDHVGLRTSGRFCWVRGTETDNNDLTVGPADRSTIDARGRPRRPAPRSRLRQRARLRTRAEEAQRGCTQVRAGTLTIE
jgi:hypothetical protein